MPKRIALGCQVSCDDGSCGRITRIVIEKATSRVTHVVVEPEHRSGLGRLVPTSLVNADTGSISIPYTSAQFNALPRAEEIEYLPGGSGAAELEAYDSYYKPFVGIEDASTPLAANASGVVLRDMPPKGTVELRPGQELRTTNGPVGRVKGVLTDDTWRINFLLLRERNRWIPRVAVVPFNQVSGPVV
jgi:hypothetical protein